MRNGNAGSIPLGFRRGGKECPLPLRAATETGLPNHGGASRRSSKPTGCPDRFSIEGGWRKREGIEPTGDIAASRPDLKSGGATSAPSASVRLASAGAGESSFPPRAGVSPIFFPLPSFGASGIFPSVSCAAGFPASVPSSSPLRRAASWKPRGHYTRRRKEDR